MMSVAPVKQRKSISEKKAVVELWNASKSTMKEFCSTHHVSLSALKYWCRQLNAQPKRKRKQKAFVPVAVSGSEQQISFVSDGLFVEIVLRNGNRLLFHQPVDIHTLKAIAG